MTAASSRTELHAQPFRPFLVRTTDGDTFTVRHPDYAIIDEEKSEVRIHESDDHYRLIAMPHIVSLEPIREQQKKPGKR
jgi:hypothetical protein